MRTLLIIHTLTFTARLLLSLTGRSSGFPSSAPSVTLRSCCHVTPEIRPGCRLTGGRDKRSAMETGGQPFDPSITAITTEHQTNADEHSLTHFRKSPEYTHLCNYIDPFHGLKPRRSCHTMFSTGFPLFRQRELFLVAEMLAAHVIDLPVTASVCHFQVILWVIVNTWHASHSILDCLCSLSPYCLISSITITTSCFPIPSICFRDPVNDWFESLAQCLHWNVRKKQNYLCSKEDVF